MFEKFGEFNSAEEINRAVAAQLEEGDTEAIFAIAEENGIDQEDAQDYIDGCVDEMVNPLMATIGKIKVESMELDIKGLLDSWKDCILQIASEDEEFCKAVRKKGKRLEKCMGELLKNGFQTKVKLDDRIVKAAELNPPIYLGVPSLAEAKEIIKEYYLGGSK